MTSRPIRLLPRHANAERSDDLSEAGVTEPVVP